MDRIGKKILLVIAVVPLFLGWQYYRKSQKLEETLAEMTEMCGDDSSCRVAVKRHAEDCFEANYEIKRYGSGIKMDEFVACVNDEAGSELFVSVPAE